MARRDNGFPSTVAGTAPFIRKGGLASLLAPYLVSCGDRNTKYDILLLALVSRTVLNHFYGFHRTSFQLFEVETVFLFYICVEISPLLFDSVQNRFMPYGFYLIGVPLCLCMFGLFLPLHVSFCR